MPSGIVEIPTDQLASSIWLVLTEPTSTSPGLLRRYRPQLHIESKAGTAPNTQLFLNLK